MNLIEFVKGAIKRMLSPKTIEQVLSIQPLVSTKMRDSIDLWRSLYQNESPWLTDNIHSLGLASMIASEKARTATIEMEIKITGDSERAKYLEKHCQKLFKDIRKQLEYGIALGGLVIKPYVTKGTDDKYNISFSYVKADDFYPMSFTADGEVTEAAFIDRVITAQLIYSKLEYHKLENGMLTVTNTCYKSANRGSLVSYPRSTELGEQIPLTEVPEWSQLEPVVTIENMDTLLFAYFKMPEANTVDLSSPLGVSGFSKAVGLIKDADEQYSNLLWEFEGGQLAIDVDRTALNPIYDKNGNQTEVLPKLQDRLYRRTLDLGDDNAYNVFSPNLRDVNIINGLNNILTHIEDTCSISRGTLSQTDAVQERTATEMRILKQRTYAANTDIQIALQSALETSIRVADKYCDLYDIVPSGEYEVTYKWDDSIIVDKDTERQVDLLDVNNGLLSKVEYRMKWMGETEKQAEEALQRISDEKQSEMEMQMEVTMKQQEVHAGTNLNDDNTQFSKTRRANESGKVSTEDK